MLYNSDKHGCRSLRLQRRAGTNLTAGWHRCHEEESELEKEEEWYGEVPCRGTARRAPIVLLAQLAPRPAPARSLRRQDAAAKQAGLPTQRTARVPMRHAHARAALGRVVPLAAG